MSHHHGKLAKSLAASVDLPEAKAHEILDVIFDTTPGKGIIAIELDAGREVSIAGFGKFSSRRRGARQGRNPAAGATIQIAAKSYPFFKPSKGLKDRVAE